MKALSRAIFLLPLLMLCSSIDGQAQVLQCENRTLNGKLGFTNVSLAVPAPAGGPIFAQSIGLPVPLTDSGVVFGSTNPLDYTDVLCAFDNGNFWLTTVLGVGSQSYRFGYAANSFAAPGYPNFLNGVYEPVSTPANPSSPDPLPELDLLECASKVGIHFIEPDGAGGFRPSQNTIAGGTVYAFPRSDPGQSVAPFDYLANAISSATGGAQAQRQLPPGAQSQTLDLFVRSSAQPVGPNVDYQVRVDWAMTCDPAHTQANPACPNQSGSANASAAFEGVSAVFGSFGPGGAASVAGQNPGLSLACDGAQDLFVVLPSQCPQPSCSVPPPLGEYQGCANLIGEAEVGFAGRTLVTSFDANSAPLSNTGQPPAPFSSLFDAFDVNASEGIYDIHNALADRVHSVQSYFALDPLPPVTGNPQNFLNSPVAQTAAPPVGGTATGPDFCMVPGLYAGTVTLNDSVAGGRPSGAAADLLLPGSLLQAFGPASGLAQRDLRGGTYDPAAGVFTIPYENIFANPDHSSGTWSQPRMFHTFSNASQDPTLFAAGESRIDFAQPTGQVLFDSNDFISTAAGGNWTGSLSPGTQIASRTARTVPQDYELCYSTLRIQVNTRTASFFNPLITQYTGSFQDDRGTPDTSDDIIYGVFRADNWKGTPTDEASATNVGFVNMHLPQGHYTGIGGVITTVLGPGRFGTAQLPTIDLDLPCGGSCTAIPNAILCLTPIDRCNEPTIVATGSQEIAGTLNHDHPIVGGFYRINDGPEVPIDLAAAGVTCGPTPCSDPFHVLVSGFGACRSKVEISFADSEGNDISAFLATTNDQARPAYRVNPLQDPGTPPYTCGSPIQLSCGNVSRSVVPIPTPSDNCSTVGNLESPLIATDDAPAVFPYGTTVVTLSSVDSCGNGVTCQAPVTIEDTTPPIVQCGSPAGVTFGADGQCVAQASIPATVTDNCSASADMTITNHVDFPNGSMADGSGPSVNQTFPLGSSTVSFTATDARNNSTTCSAPVVVVDSAPPRDDCPAAETLDANAVCVAPRQLMASIVDNCDSIGLLTITNRTTLSNGTITDGLGAAVDRNFLLGANSVTFKAEDSKGNTAMCTTPVSVVDVSPPGLICPAGRARLVNGLSRVPRAVGEDQLGTLQRSGTTFAASPGAGSKDKHICPPEGCTSGEGGGSSGALPPPPVFSIVECSSPTGTAVDLIATAHDNCAISHVSNSRTGDTLDASGSFPYGPTSVDFSTLDTSGNLSQCTSLVDVVDTTPPDLTCPPDLTLTRANPNGTSRLDAGIEAWLGSVTAADQCGSVHITQNAPQVFQTSCNDTTDSTVVIFTATDQHGNQASCATKLTLVLDQDGDGVRCSQDCNDTNPLVHPGATEICDGIDNNCNGAVDEGFGTTTCGLGACQRTVTACVNGIPQTCTPGSPTAEVCNGIDDDCDGVVDNGGGAALCVDGNACTGDVCGGIAGCSHPAAADGTACDDANACTTVDVCAGGICVGNTPRTCDDGNVCTDDSCDPASGCVHAANTRNEGFSGTTLPAGWGSFLWSGGGTATVAGGVLDVDGAAARTDATYGPAMSIEFVATFNAEALQQVGFGAGGDTAPRTFETFPWAMFSTGTSGTSLQARTWDGGVAHDQDVPGTWLGSPHTYRIDWSATSVRFSIDGSLRATHTVALPGPMRVAASDFTAGGTALVLDSLTITPTCDDGNPNTVGDVCGGGVCAGVDLCLGVICAAVDQCHAAGVCDHATGTCSNPAQPDGTTCSDGNPCTRTDSCQAGTCVGSNPVSCTALDQCHVAGTCETSTGACSNPAKPDGTACNDGSACTTGDTCSGGTCVGGPPPPEICNGIDDNCDGRIDEGCVGKVTGGGEIDVPGGTSSFGFVAQRKTGTGQVTGQLEYYNHARGLDVHSTSILTLTVSGNTATFSGDCTKNKTSCTFSVTVQDNGEPGDHIDTFTIAVSGEPIEGASATIIHGNIQIHTAGFESSSVERLTPDQNANAFAGAGAGVFPIGTVFQGVPVTSLRFGTGVDIPGNGLADGTHETTLLGVSASGDPQTITVEVAITGGYVTASGEVHVSGVSSVDMGDGTPPQMSVPFSLVVTPDAQGQGTLAMTLDTTSLPAATVDQGGVTPPPCLAPSEVGVDLLFLDRPSLSWSASDAAASYNVYRGSIDGGAWNFDHVCLTSGLTSPGATDSTPPPSGKAFYYLVSGKNACGEGGLGNTSGGQPRPNPSPCP